MSVTGFCGLMDISINGLSITARSVSVHRNKETGWWRAVATEVRFLGSNFADADRLEIESEDPPIIAPWSGEVRKGGGV